MADINPEIIIDGKSSIPLTRDRLTSGRAFPLITSIGRLDLLSPDWVMLETYDDVLSVSEDTPSGKVLTIEHLIKVKENAGRDKDKLVVRQLKVIRDIQRKQK